MAVKYGLSDFYDVNSNGFKVVLPDEVVEQINQLVSQVGSPNYIRTPVFHKAPKSHTSTGRKRKDFKLQANMDELWNNMNKRPAPKEEKAEENEISIQHVRSFLNKLTDKNVDEISDKLIKMIDVVVEQKDSQMMDSIAKSIFEIASSNKFFSNVYADLYSILCTKYHIMQSLLEENYSQFLKQFDTIDYVSPEDDYDGFCRMNKQNDKRRALSTFYLNLYCIGVLPIEKIEFLLINIMNKLLESMNQENKTAHVEEYTENIAILYQHDMEYNESTLLSNGKNIKDTMVFLAQTKNKTFPSLTSKCIFKYMDICDM